MLFHGKKFLIVTAALALVAFAGGAASAQTVIIRPGYSWASYRHERIDGLAHRLERDARILNREARTHCNGFPAYRLFEAEVNEIVRLADHIHDVACSGGSLHHLRHDLARLDRLYQSAERLFDRLVWEHRLDRTTVHHLRAALNRVENDIGILRDELI